MGELLQRQKVVSASGLLDKAKKLPSGKKAGWYYNYPTNDQWFVMDVGNDCWVNGYESSSRNITSVETGDSSDGPWTNPRHGVRARNQTSMRTDRGIGRYTSN